jgi:hypothetical protein
LSLKDEYKGVLQGKITLPSKINGKDVEAISKNAF